MNKQDQEVTLAEIKKDIEYIKEFIEKSNTRFASKFTEKAFWWFSSTIIITLMTLLLKVY